MRGRALRVVGDDRYRGDRARHDRDRADRDAADGAGLGANGRAARLSARGGRRLLGLL